MQDGGRRQLNLGRPLPFINQFGQSSLKLIGVLRRQCRTHFDIGNEVSTKSIMVSSAIVNFEESLLFPDLMTDITKFSGIIVKLM